MKKWTGVDWSPADSTSANGKFAGLVPHVLFTLKSLGLFLFFNPFCSHLSMADMTTNIWVQL